MLEEIEPFFLFVNWKAPQNEAANTFVIPSKAY